MGPSTPEALRLQQDQEVSRVNMKRDFSASSAPLA